jgi:hypothetical protein
MEAMKRIIVRAIAVAGLCSACSDPTVPAQRSVPAFGYDPENISRSYIVPDTVARNTTFNVTIFPRLGCGQDAIPALVSVSGNTADVTAQAMYPRHERGAVFTCEGRILNKSVGQVRFETAGPATVRLHASTIDGSRDTVVTVPVLVKN